MKATCPISGIHFTISPGFGNVNTPHPIFHMPLAKLLQAQMTPFAFARLSEVETHLFGAAVLRHLPVTRWTHPLASPRITAPVWGKYLVRMANLASRIDGRTIEKIPHYCVTRDNCNLEDLGNYVDLLESFILTNLTFSFVENRSKLNNDKVTEDIFKILRSVETVAIRRNKLPELMAHWAAVNGNFDKYVIYHEGRKQTAYTYWRHLVTLAFTPDNLMELIKVDSTKRDLTEDFVELLEYCEATIPFGSIHTDTLFSKLRETIDVLREFRPKRVEISLADLESMRVESPHANDGVDSYSISAPLAPRPEPKRNEYPSMIAYTKARLAWAKYVLGESDRRNQPKASDL